MPTQTKNDEDRRVKRTQKLVFDAFFQLVQTSRYDDLKTKNIIDKSGIGRSTFYEHFTDKDDVLSQSLEYPMSIFASALIGISEKEDLMSMLTHFWERRIFARVILQNPTREVVDNCLRQQIISKLGDGKDFQANASFLSSGFLSLLNEWLTGRLSCNADDMCKYIENYCHRDIRA